MKTINKFMERVSKKVTLLVVLLSASAGVIYIASADQNEQVKWSELPSTEIQGILHNEALSDEEKVAALTYHLDKRISVAPFVPQNIPGPKSETNKFEPGYEWAWLIDMMVEGDWRKGPPARPQTVAAVLANLDKMPNIKNKREVRSLLYVALALAGGDAPENELLRMLNDPDTPQEIVYQILGGMLGSKRPQDGRLPGLVEVTGCPSRVPLRALPRLLELTEHPWSYLGGTDVITDDKPRERIYPIRELACACLLQLGVQATKVTVPATGKNEDGDPQNFITKIQVDRVSANKKLRELK